MPMPKSPPALIARFDTVATDFPEASRRLTFGYPCLYVGGNMVTGLFGDSWHVRVGKDDTTALLALPGARPFEPMPGRPMTGFTLLPESIVDDDTAVRDWVARAIAHVSTMPAKTPKPRTPKASKAKPVSS
jgi:TfoX/Sxy family transcriptional regulator of competence genes